MRKWIENIVVALFKKRLADRESQTESDLRPLYDDFRRSPRVVVCNVNKEPYIDPPFVDEFIV